MSESGKPGAGRPQKLGLLQRMAIRRRVQAWKGRKAVIYRALAAELNVSVTTIGRIVRG